MDISLIADPVALATAKGLGLAIRRHCLTSSGGQISTIPEQLSTFSGGVLQISSVIFPVDALAPPPVKSYSYRTLPRSLLRKKRRSKRKSLSGDDSEDGGEEEEGEERFFGSGSGGPFFGGGGSGGGGGRGRNFDGSGGHSWDDWSSSPSSSSPALNFVYEVLSWIALSNCVHYAFKKVIRIVADGIGDGAREKVVAT